MAPPSLNAGLVRSIAVSTPLGSSLGPAGASWGPPPHEGRKTMISTSSVALYVALPSFSGSSLLDDTRMASSLRLEHAVPVHRAGVGMPPIYGEILRAHRVVSGVGVGSVGRDDVRDPAEQSTGADP